MTEFFFEHGSYLGIIAILVLTGTGMPIPEEVPVIAAGLLSANGQLDPWLAFFACLAGALGGDCVMYWIGRHFGRNVVREHPWWAHFVNPDREAQLERTLQDHDWKVFFFARFLVGIRSPVYLAAGVLRVPFRRFIMIDLVCATAVIGTFFGLSFYFGETIVRWIRNAEYTLTGIVVLAVAIVAGIYYYRRRKKKMKTQAKELFATNDIPAENLGTDIEESEDEQPQDETEEEKIPAPDEAIVATSIGNTATNDDDLNK
ncbi:MAG: DedA family protein [Pirellulales bacterium]|nr:DedA family protein [Pirellulales bacterium]